MLLNAENSQFGNAIGGAPPPLCLLWSRRHSVAGRKADLRDISGDRLTGRKTIAAWEPLPRRSGLGEGCLWAHSTACVRSGADDDEGVDGWLVEIRLSMFSRLLFLSAEPLEPELPKDRKLLLDTVGGGLVATGLAMLETGAAAELDNDGGVFETVLFDSDAGFGRVLSGFGRVGLGLLELSTLKNFRGDGGGGTGSGLAICASAFFFSAPNTPANVGV